MKKIISVLLVLLLALSFSACGKEEKKTYENTPEGTVSRLFDSIREYDESKAVSCFMSGEGESAGFFPKSESMEKYEGIYRALLSKLTCETEKTDYNADETAAAVTVKVNYCDATDAILSSLVEVKMNIGDSKKDFYELLAKTFAQKLEESPAMKETEMILPCVRDGDGNWIIGGVSDKISSQFSEFFTCGISEGIDKFNELSGTDN